MISTTGSHAGYGPPMTSGGNDNGSCSLARRGSLTATTTRRFHSGSNARTRLSISILRGGYARVVPLREDFAYPAARCPRVAWTRAVDACETNGAELGGSGGVVGQTPRPYIPGCPGTGLTRRCTCSAPGGRRGSSSMPFTSKRRRRVQGAWEQFYRTRRQRHNARADQFAAPTYSVSG